MATLLNGSEVKIKKIDNGYVLQWREELPPYMGVSMLQGTTVVKEYHSKDKEGVFAYLNSIL